MNSIKSAIKINRSFKFKSEVLCIREEMSVYTVVECSIILFIFEKKFLEDIEVIMLEWVMENDIEKVEITKFCI